MLFDRLLREDILQKLTAVQQGGFLSQSRGGGRGLIITQRLIIPLGNSVFFFISDFFRVARGMFGRSDRDI